jgi:hypothetical protein
MSFRWQSNCRSNRSGKYGLHCRNLLCVPDLNYAAPTANLRYESQHATVYNFVIR